MSARGLLGSAKNGPVGALQKCISNLHPNDGWRRQWREFDRHAALKIAFFGILLVFLRGMACAQSPTYMSANPSTLTMPGSITFCDGVPNITVDLQYWYNGSFIEADGQVSFGSNGCVSNYYSYDGYASTYTFTGIRNSALGGSFNSIYAVVTLNPSVQPPSINYFYPSPDPITAGECTYLYYSTSNASYVKIDGTYVGVSGYYEECPTSTTTTARALRDKFSTWS